MKTDLISFKGMGDGVRINIALFAPFPSWAVPVLPPICIGYPSNIELALPSSATFLMP